MPDQSIGSQPDTLRKIAVLESAAAGNVLTAAESAVLMAIADDYRPMIEVGNGKSVSVQDMMKAVKIIAEDVPYMVGWRRREAIVLLNRIRARGFDMISPADLRVDQADSDFADEMSSQVYPDEIAEAVGE